MDIVQMLSEECVLMTVKSKKWGGSKADKESAQIVANEYNGDTDGFSNSQMKLLPPDWRKKLAKVGQKVGDSIHNAGIPFNGGYLIRASDYMRIKAETDVELANLMAVVDEIIVNRQPIENWAKIHLGDKYSDGIIPPDEEIRGKFKFEIKMTSLGLPPAKLGQAGVDEIKSKLADEYKGAMQTVIDSVKEIVAESREFVEAAEKGDARQWKPTGRWEAIQKELGRLKTMNIGIEGLDDTITTLGTLIEAAKPVTAKQIRDDKNSAQVVKGTFNAVDELLSNF